MVSNYILPYIITIFSVLCMYLCNKLKNISYQHLCEIQTGLPCSLQRFQLLSETIRRTPSYPEIIVKIEYSLNVVQTVFDQ